MEKQQVTKPTIGVDIDDVIAENAPAFIQWTNKKYGTHLTLNDYNDHWGELWKVEHEEEGRISVEYHESGHIATYEPVVGAEEALKKLGERFILVVLTSRQKSINKLTEEWIAKYYPNLFNRVVFAGFFDNFTKESIRMTKGELAKNLGVDYLIDDQLKHVQAAAELGIQSILFGHYPWNKANTLPPNVTRVKNWAEVLEYFEKIKTTP